MCFGCPSKNLIYVYFVVPFMPSTNLTYLSLTTKVGTCLLVSFWNFPCFYLNLLQYWWSFMSGLMYSFQISSLHWSCILKSVGDCVMSRQHYSAIEKELEYMCFLGPWWISCLPYCTWHREVAFGLYKFLEYAEFVLFFRHELLWLLHYFIFP